MATSRSHLDEATEEFLARLPVAKRFLCGSSVKFCYLAQGEADVYPRLSPTHEWDIAAGCAILAAAGGAVTAPDGGQLAFGRRAEKFLVPGFIAWGDPAKAAAAPTHDGRPVQRAMVRATAGHLRVARSRMSAGLGQEGRARLGAIKEIKPLADHHPEQRVTRHRQRRGRSPPDRNRRSAAV